MSGEMPFTTEDLKWYLDRPPPLSFRSLRDRLASTEAEREEFRSYLATCAGKLMVAEAALATAREALKPFADAVRHLDPSWHDDTEFSEEVPNLTYKHLRAALQALSGSEAGS